MHMPSKGTTWPINFTKTA